MNRTVSLQQSVMQDVLAMMYDVKAVRRLRTVSGEMMGAERRRKRMPLKNKKTHGL